METLFALAAEAGFAPNVVRSQLEAMRAACAAELDRRKRTAERRLLPAEVPYELALIDYAKEHFYI